MPIDPTIASIISTMNSGTLVSDEDLTKVSATAKAAIDSLTHFGTYAAPMRAWLFQIKDQADTILANRRGMKWQAAQDARTKWQGTNPFDATSHKIFQEPKSGNS